MTKLTIAIPTYNRPEKLMATVSALIPQLKDNDVNIIIIDNASTQPVADLLKPFNEYYGNGLSVYRNKVNVGLAANLIRALETAESEWIWLLGDDDVPIEDSVKRLLAHLNAVNDNIFLLKFNSDAGSKVDKDITLFGVDKVSEFVSDPGIYSNFLFISNSVFRREKINAHVRVMYNFVGSLAPHVPGILAALIDGNGIIWKTEYLTDHGRPETPQQHWDTHTLRSGFVKLAEMDFDDNFVDKAMPSINSRYLGKGFYKRVYFLPFRTRYYSSGYWRRYFFKMAGIYSGFKMLFVLFCGVQITYVYKIKWLYNYFSKRVGKIEQGNLDRS